MEVLRRWNRDKSAQDGQSLQPRHHVGCACSAKQMGMCVFAVRSATPHLDKDGLGLQPVGMWSREGAGFRVARARAQVRVPVRGAVLLHEDQHDRLLPDVLLLRLHAHAVPGPGHPVRRDRLPGVRRVRAPHLPQHQVRLSATPGTFWGFGPNPGLRPRQLAQRGRARVRACPELPHVRYISSATEGRGHDALHVEQLAVLLRAQLHWQETWLAVSRLYDLAVGTLPGTRRGAVPGI